MKSTNALVLACALLVCGACFAQSVESSSRLRDIEREDQADRQARPIDWTVVTPRDDVRRQSVRELLRAGQVRTAEDHYNAALVFQHGDKPDDIRLAFSLATTATAIDPDDMRSRRLAAASWDRLMVYPKRPQWYGTQYRRLDNGKLELNAIDETAVSDEERAAAGVPSLAEARARTRFDR